ncbi:hypothetical protein [Fusobacterium mortiferum]|uniref:TMhelix containing protein n=1 Tax=Fusobacterium mortiferum TaxID=850 RepID=A0ABS2G0F4_FUSMR|nr:hypothetical protein [Fusobacterium mortiferum]MBM6874700.1 hypothetical protein [Fusobacterium mortiferum]
MLNILGVIDKILDVVLKRSKDAEKQQDIELKQQDIEIKKVDEYKQVIMIVVCVALFMCAVASFFPGLAISEWWFNLAETVIKNKL